MIVPTGFPGDVIDRCGVTLCEGDRVEVITGSRAGSVGRVIGWDPDSVLQVFLDADDIGGTDILLIEPKSVLRVGLSRSDI